MKFNRLLQRDSSAAVMFLLPSLIGFGLFFLIPFAAGGYYSLVDSPVNGSFVGLSNYVELLESSSFRKAASNTALFTAVSVPLLMVISLLLALLLMRDVYARNWIRTFYVMPLVVPVASIVMLWQILFDGNGFLNAFLQEQGLATKDWMGSGTARAVVLLIFLWKNTGYNMVLYLAGLQNIPEDYYEAASVEGAGWWWKLRHITLVYLTPTAFFVFVMSVIGSFKVFRETYLIAGEYPDESIYMLQHYMNNMFLSLDYQKLTSAAYVMALVITVFVAVVFRLERALRRRME
ncbi:carbohydrate ABC transporter permease [Paenibacillus sp. CF384]|uniref:carbohydrate ABC transporter permease n=1 Tax=Paenibacillus sp. CF384 TaxID=1884382 RepID=UPI00089C7F88|nr:sugar ABC transporter permease [Paenibacillus sp. CF384]SDW66206.1 carbohydrate ABC transporter membrane protein 1, CUT1 family [Paenibacillus sp. CF384]